MELIMKYDRKLNCEMKYLSFCKDLNIQLLLANHSQFKMSNKYENQARIKVDSWYQNGIFTLEKDFFYFPVLSVQFADVNHGIQVSIS